MDVLHRVLIKGGMTSVWEAERRLREHGLEPSRAPSDPHAGQAIDFTVDSDLTLDFLRPDFLPPRQMTVEQYVDYVKTGRRDDAVHLPDTATMRRAQEILVADGIIEKVYV